MLKKLLALALSSICFISFWGVCGKLEFYGYANNLEVYTKSSSIGKIYTTDGRFVFLNGNIKGESFKCEKERFDLHKFFEEFEVTLLFSEEIAEGTGYYGYSEKIKYKKEVYGQTVNVHVFISENLVTVGSPIIFGSF